MLEVKKIEIESIDQLLVSHSISKTKNQSKLHMHNNAYEIMLFISGNVTYFINDNSYNLQPGDITLICPDKLHGFTQRDYSTYERMPIHISRTYAQSLCNEQTNLFSFFHTSATTPIAHLTPEDMTTFKQHAFAIIESLRKRDFGYEISVRSHLSLLLLLAHKTYHSGLKANTSTMPFTTPLISNAIDYINSNLTSNISTDSIAAALGLSVSRFSHLFKDDTGFSPWNYVIARRIQYSCTLLQNGYSITDACYECGFNDYAHFIKSFSKLIGVSPGKYCKTLYIDDAVGNSNVSEINTTIIKQSILK